MLSGSVESFAVEAAAATVAAWLTAAAGGAEARTGGLSGATLGRGGWAGADAELEGCGESEGPATIATRHVKAGG
jgi:hypothetical protein